jgi:hypothetical protein
MCFADGLKKKKYKNKSSYKMFPPFLMEKPVFTYQEDDANGMTLQDHKSHETGR